MNINGKTKAVGLIGWPVEHTMSPLIQNAAFEAAGLDYVYIPLAVRPDQLGQAVAGLRSLGFAGVNVTVPHKVNVMDHIDCVQRSAELVGAVNTIVFTDGQATGYNTDMDGFIQSLKNEKVVIKGKKAVLLGAGGAARAVVCGLLEHGANEVLIGARDGQKAQLFAASFAGIGQTIGHSWYDDDFTNSLLECDILVNCTPVGMYPQVNDEVSLVWDKLQPTCVVCDLIYNPATTKFLERARREGHKTVGGAAMLIEQGALAFELWTGISAPRDVMYKKLAEVIAAKR